MAKGHSPLYVTMAKQKKRPKRISWRNYGLILVAVLYVATVMMAKVFLERRTKDMGVEWEQKHRALTVLIKENENLRIERETYMGADHILTHAREWGLRETPPGQVRTLRKSVPTPPQSPMVAMGQTR